MRRFATFVAAGCLLAPGAARAQAEAALPAAEIAPAATAVAPTPAPVKYRTPKSSATAKPPTTSVKSSAPDFVAPPVPESAAAPVAAAVPPPVAPVVAPPAAPKPAPAAKPGEWLRKEKPPAASPATKDGPSPLRIAGMLLLVATLGGVAYYAKRKKQLPKLGESKAALRVVGSTRVGPKATAVVVEIAGKRILLGVTEQSVSNLAWLDDEANASVETSEDTHVTARASRARGIDDVAAAGPSGFLKLLRNAVGTGATPKGAAIDEVARTTRDEVRLTRRVEPTALTEELLEGQVAGLTKRRRDLP